MLSAVQTHLCHLVIWIGLLPTALWSCSTAAAEPFSFQNDDVVAIFGNGLADRMQHDPWVETALQHHLKGMNVRFRNMSFSGDTVAKRPRNKGFTNDAEYLRHVDPDVVFMFYGYNESFAGAEGVDQYQSDLANLVRRYGELRDEAGRDVRFVLFSPIAYENTGDPHLPDGIELNANLALYTAATRRAAEETGAAFVDLFTPTTRCSIPARLHRRRRSIRKKLP